MKTEATCEQRIDEELRSRLDEIGQALDAYEQQETVGDYGPDDWSEYGLAFSYVVPETNHNGEPIGGYFCFQMSYGGPADEFRFYAAPAERNSYALLRCEYWFLDWFDGASRTLRDADWQLALRMWEHFDSCESPAYAVAQALEA